MRAERNRKGISPALTRDRQMYVRSEIVEHLLLKIFWCLCRQLRGLSATAFGK